MQRMIARAQLLADEEMKALASVERLREKLLPWIEEGKFMTAALFKWERNLFLYVESMMDEPPAPEELMRDLSSYLEPWPGQAEKRLWIPMIDVFHFNAPASPEHWRRKAAVERRVGRVAHLKPEMAASYIYYHYQLQEEHAFHGPKYEIIAMHENLLFGYQEFPTVVEEPILPRKLMTSGTPTDWSESRMDLHFQPWPDGHLYFKPVETWFALGE
ncbi:hypothetical protein SAMN04487969_1157 [Paenibacillus algorifonticola]|uniref:Uncharacterized protein n=1 Tax=Paenibacillus algorifonticola TaxID=684063 RepID=A0A1I2G9E8_9BACL|nr:hypothetical protein [Paenibacillus algorifonticola]SFF13600.1 hypothetical protein SAMN04487969_1157 [Paenibacillus algorifonticola]